MVRDWENDVLSIKFYVYEYNHWTLCQEFFGRQGEYTFYPYYYGVKTVYPFGNLLPSNVKIVISDNINTIGINILRLDSGSTERNQFYR
jgi:hypothetical protein